MLVSAVALIDPTGRVLLQRRHTGRAHGGLWEYPGGKLEPGESPEAAAVREIDEELVLRIAPSALQAVTFASEPHASAGSLVLLLYACRTWQGEPLCRGGEAIRWFAGDALATLPMPPLDIRCTAALRALL
ncbi:MAG: (deoxy)nucleoside triphosphate pyrophosphohydrolase [Novosphingobium sp.]